MAVLTIYCPILRNSTGVDTDGSVRICCHSTYGVDYFNSIENKRFADYASVSEILNSKTYKKLRETFSSGKFPAMCSGCEESEKKTGHSPRLGMIGKENGSTSDSIKLKYLLISLDNNCNLKCRSCSPRYSSNINKDFVKAGGNTNDDIDFKINNKSLGALLDDDRWVVETFKDIEELEITGGEPFLSPLFLKLIKRIDQLKLSNNIQINIITNGTVIKNDYFNFLAQFKKVNILISIDSVGDKLEYIRYPIKWHTLNRNIELYLSMLDSYTNMSISFMTVIHAYSIQGVVDLIKQLYKYRNRVSFIPSFDFIKDPVSLIINVLEISRLKDILTDLENLYADYERDLEVDNDSLGRFNVLISSLRSYINDYNRGDVIGFKVITSIFDRIRKQDYNKTFLD